jgi:RNA polymerase sigma factor (TIGR02999 family)
MNASARARPFRYSGRTMTQEVTRILSAIDAGDEQAAEALLPLVYEQLRVLADARLAREKPGQTLAPTGLVHEAYLRLVGPMPGGVDGAESGAGAEPIRWDSRGHFFAAAAEAMRRILIDRARARGAIKRGGGAVHLHLDEDLLSLDQTPGELLDLDDALKRLASEDEVKAQLVKLRFFAGLTLARAAAVLGISRSTAERHWAYARAFLYTQLADDEKKSPEA